MSALECTRDGFLDHRIEIDQPRHGFRAGHDSVLLAACVPAADGDHVLELGSGAGVASLCLAARLPACRITGVEIDPDLVVLANANAQRNAMADRAQFVAGDVKRVAFPDRHFAHVFFNPPFHPARGQISPNRARDIAMRDVDAALDNWTDHALSLVAEDGSVTLVLRADRLEAWRARLHCALVVLPLVPHGDDAPKRVIALLRPGGPASYRELAPLVLHQPDGGPTAQADAVLRHGEAIAMEVP